MALDEPDPDDLETFLVHGDELQRRGDPRGELIAVQARLHTAPDDDALRQREAQLLARHGARWLGALAAFGPRDLRVTWRWGFMRAVHLGPPTDLHVKGTMHIPSAIAELARLPGTAYLRELSVGAVDDDSFEPSWASTVLAIAEHGLPENLAALDIDCGAYWEVSRTTLGDFSVAYPACQRLDKLRIRIGRLQLGAIALPALRSLEIVTPGLTKAHLQSIAGALWPELERLSLYLGESGGTAGCDIDVLDLQPIVEGANLKRLRHLGLVNSSIADAIVMALARGGIVRQLESLDLSRGTFSDVGAQAILAHASTFCHLRQIDLSHAYLSDSMREALSRLGPRVVLEDPQSADDDFREVAMTR